METGAAARPVGKRGGRYSQRDGQLNRQTSTCPRTCAMGTWWSALAGVVEGARGDAGWLGRAGDRISHFDRRRNRSMRGCRLQNTLRRAGSVRRNRGNRIGTRVRRRVGARRRAGLAPSRHRGICSFVCGCLLGLGCIGRWLIRFSRQPLRENIRGSYRSGL
jgi:hypothetical protein